MTREAIIAATLGIAEHKGWEKTTVRAISQAIGYSTIKIYADFGSKEGLFREIQARGFSQLLATYRDSIMPAVGGVETLVSLTLAHFRFARTHAALYDLMFQLGGAPCSLPGGDHLRITSEPVRACLEALHGQVDRTLFFHWWTLAHGFVAISRIDTSLDQAAAEVMLQKIVRQFATNL